GQRRAGRQEMRVVRDVERVQAPSRRRRQAMTATLQGRLRCYSAGLGKDAGLRYGALLLEEAAAELSRLESACESAVVEIDRLRRQLELPEAANPALLGALERA